MVSFKIIDHGVGIISTAILARLLVPEDFRLITLASSLTAIIELLRGTDWKQPSFNEPTRIAHTSMLPGRSISGLVIVSDCWLQHFLDPPPTFMPTPFGLGNAHDRLAPCHWRIRKCRWRIFRK